MHLPMAYYAVPILVHLTHVIVLATILLILCVPRGHTDHYPETERGASDDEIGITTINVGVVETGVATKVGTDPATRLTEIETGVETEMEILAIEVTDVKSQIVTTAIVNGMTGTDVAREMSWTTFQVAPTTKNGQKG